MKYLLRQELCDPDLAAIVIQSLIRGCSIGTQMADGLSLNHGVMLELRTTNPLWEDSKIILALRKKRQRIAVEHRDELILQVRYCIRV